MESIVPRPRTVLGIAFPIALTLFYGCEGYKGHRNTEIAIIARGAEYVMEKYDTNRNNKLGFWERMSITEDMEIGTFEWKEKKR